MRDIEEDNEYLLTYEGSPPMVGDIFYVSTGGVGEKVTTKYKVVSVEYNAEQILGHDFTVSAEVELMIYNDILD